jgi:hypothetical protein
MDRVQGLLFIHWCCVFTRFCISPSFSWIPRFYFSVILRHGVLAFVFGLDWIGLGWWYSCAVVGRDGQGKTGREDATQGFYSDNSVYELIPTT